MLLYSVSEPIIALHCNAMVSDRTRLSYLCQLKYLTIFDRKKDEGPRNSKGFLIDTFLNLKRNLIRVLIPTDSEILDLA